MSDKHTSQICRSAIALMRDLSSCYGPERGIELFTKLCETLGDDVKNQVFMGMLGAGYPDNSVRITSGSGNVGSAVAAMLKHAIINNIQAKTLVEQVKKNGIPQVFYCRNSSGVEIVKKELRDIGYFCD